MKKIKLIATLLISLIILCSMSAISKAASFDATISKTTVTVGDTFTVTATANNAIGTYTVTPSNSNATITSSKDGFLENNSQTWTFKAQKAGTVTITVKTTDMIDADDDTKTVTKTKTFTVTIKEKATSNNSSGGSSSSSGNTTSNKPNFTTVNKKVYTTNDVRLRSSWSTSSSAVLVSAGTELTLTGTSKEIVNDYIWYRVTYKGATKYVASNFVSETKPEDVDYPENIKSSNNNLSSLTIEGLTLEPSFNSDVLDYTANLEEDLDKLTVTTKTENSKATAKVEGNENLKTGENTIKITVTAEDGTKKTYTVKVTKTSSTNTPDTTQTTDDGKLKLKTLEISGVNFSDGFNPDQYSYELSLNFVVNELNITAVANREDATIEILGNNDFKEGENLVTILVKSASEEETASYQIKVTLPRGVVQKQGNIEFYIKCVVIAFAVLLVILIITLISKKAKKRNDYADIEEETIPTANINKESRKADDSMEDEDSNADFLDNIEITKKPKRSKGKHSV